MKKLWVIAYREYVAMVGTKAFVFSLVMMPILMFGSLLLMPSLQKLGGGRDLKILVADGTGVLYEELKSFAESHNELASKAVDSQDESEQISGMMGSSDRWILEQAPSNALDDEQRLAIGKRIQQGEVYGLLEIAPRLLEKPQFDSDPSDPNPNQGTPPAGAVSSTRLYSFDSLMSPVRQGLGAVLQQRVRQSRIEQFELASLDPRILASINARIEIEPAKPPTKEENGKSQSQMDALKAMFLPFGVMMLMFMVILMAAQPMLESAMEEKTLRISEVLLGSVTPTQLLGGKLLGNVAGSLVIFILYGCGGVFVLNGQGMLGDLPLHLAPWFVIFQLLGVLFFSSIFLVVGSSVSELKEAQSLLLPVWMVLMAPVMVWFVAVRDPNGLVATSLSFFPPSCPLTMVLRLATGTAVPWWQPYVAATIMLFSTLAMVTFAGRIYRIGLLKSDGVRSVMQLLKRASQPC